METTLRDLCQRHGLYCINVQFLADTAPCFCVFVHWSEPGAVVRCVHGKGDTFDAAFAAALVSLSAARPEPGAGLVAAVRTALTGADAERPDPDLSSLPSADDAYAVMGWDTSLRGKDTPEIADAMLGD